ncbi:MAG: hypothetical protein ACREJV_13585 [Candidatus Rokuibacteriota bacterium]
MKTSRAVCTALVIWTWSAMVAHAQELRYLGPSSGTTGWIELAPGQATEVTVGAEIPGWGRVARIVESHLVIERRVSEAEQERLRSQGMAAYEVLELLIPRVDLGTHPLPAPR